MLRKIIFIFCVCSSFAGMAQKETRETIDAENLKSINLDTDEVYLITIIATTGNQIKLSSHSEGEYYNNIGLTSAVSGDMLTINTDYPERLSGGYDKLSAHKVFSLEIQLEVPQGMEINITSNIASLETTGAFKVLTAGLKQGYCRLNNFSGEATINTYSGNILVETNSGSIEAKSRNGGVKLPVAISGQNIIKLTSIDGDIKVRKN